MPHLLLSPSRPEFTFWKRSAHLIVKCNMDKDKTDGAQAFVRYTDRSKLRLTMYANDAKCLYLSH